METLADLKKEYAGKTVDELLLIINELKAENSFFRNNLFASKRERRLVHAEGQGKLFDEAEHILSESSESGDSEGSEDSTETNNSPEKNSNSSRGKTGRKSGKNSRSQKPFPANFPRVKKEIDLPDSKKRCPLHGTKLEKIGSVVTERLHIIPAQLQVIEESRPTYKCSCCEAEEKPSFTKPDQETRAIPGSFATEDLIAYVIANKYVDGLPLYRQQRIFERLGIDLSRTTMSGWVMKIAELAAPLMQLIHEELLNSKVLHGDETTIQVLKESGKSAKSKSYVWTLGRQGLKPLIFLKYYRDRSSGSAMDLLAGFKGNLVCDGYTAYSNAAMKLGFTTSGCLAHVRRKFYQADKSAGNKKGSKKTTRAAEALDMIDRIYNLEREIKSEPPDKRLEFRKDSVKPIFDQLFEWLLNMKGRVLPSSPTGKAIEYALKQWPRLEMVFTNAEIDIDNNFMERAIRPFVIGRKGWLFSNSVKGAHASTTIYSLVESAKSNGIEPVDYLSLIIKELPKFETIEDLEKLLPYNATEHFDLKKFATSL